MRKIVRCGLAKVGLAFGAIGCVSTPHTALKNKPPKPLTLENVASRNAPDPAYPVGVGDRLRIRRPADPAPVSVLVQPNGEIELANRKPMRVDGLTCSQIEEQLGDDPSGSRPTVHVDHYNSKFVYFYHSSRGMAPTEAPYRGRESVAEFLDRLGLSQQTEGRRVRVVRPAKVVGQSPALFTANLDPTNDTLGDRPERIFLEPSDYIYLEDNLPKGDRDRFQRAKAESNSRRRFFSWP